jgi:group I intron endonuclease
MTPVPTKFSFSAALAALHSAVREAPRRPGIYRLTNNITGKCYVGQATDLRRRLSAHLRQLIDRTHRQPVLRAAFAKHAPRVWTFEVIEECHRSKLTERETFYVQKMRALVAGYNCAPVTAGIEPSAKFSQIARRVARAFHDRITDEERSAIARRAAATLKARRAST